MRKKKQLITGFILIIGVIVLVNVLSDNFHFRLDFTADKSYTLSKATKNILKDLKEPVTITAYFSKNLPPDFLTTRNDFKDLLIEYANVSKRKVVFEFIDPSESTETEQKATQAGVQPVIVNIREKDQVKQQKAYLGAVVQFGEKTEIIPVIQPGAAMEYALSTAIKKLSVTQKPLVGFLQGHGEPNLSAIHQVYGELGILYDVEPVTLSDSAYTLNKYKTLIIIGTKDTLPPSHIEQLERFHNEGGNICFALNHVDGNFQNATGYTLHTGIEDWLREKGLNMEDNFVVDASCGSVMVQQQQNGYVMSSQLQFPYLPVIKNFADHPITKGLEAVVLQFASTVKFSGNPATMSYTPLVFTSEKSGTIATPLNFDINKNWTESDFPLQKLPVAAVIEPKGGAKGGKIFAITDANFVINGDDQQQQQQQLQPDNINLLVNSVDWLSDDTGLIELRTKGVNARLLDQMDDGKKTFLKYFNFLIPILLIIGYGIFRANRNRSIRMKRMEAKHV
jgi:gliding-associated putative ABC transporter substrate-binding component GldG